MGACREMRLPRSESESQSISPSAAYGMMSSSAGQSGESFGSASRSGHSFVGRGVVGFLVGRGVGVSPETMR